MKESRREAEERVLSEATFGNVLISQMCQNLLCQIRHRSMGVLKTGCRSRWEDMRKLLWMHTLTQTHTYSCLLMCCFYFILFFFAEFRNKVFDNTAIYVCDVILLQCFMIVSRVYKSKQNDWNCPGWNWTSLLVIMATKSSGLELSFIIVLLPPL